MTLGPTLVALALTERARGRVARWLSAYGSVPLLFYVVHIFVAHLAAVMRVRGLSVRPRFPRELLVAP